MVCSAVGVSLKVDVLPLSMLPHHEPCHPVCVLSEVRVDAKVCTYIRTYSR